MKKIIALIATLFLSFSAFAIEFKTYLALDYDFCLGNTTYQNLSNSTEYFNTNRQGFDLDVAFYIFPKLGLYGNFSNNFLLNAEHDFVEDTTGSKFDFSFGLTYRNEVNNNLEWTIGLGPHISVLSYTLPADTGECSFTGLGISATGGIRFNLFKVAFLTSGISGHYDLSLLGATSNGYDNTDLIKHFSVIDVKAYLGIGLIITELF